MRKMKTTCALRQDEVYLKYCFLLLIFHNNFPAITYTGSVARVHLLGCPRNPS